MTSDPTLTGLLELDSVTIGYGRRPVLQDCSFTIHRGSMIFVFGANAAGKTTLLRAIAGVLPVSRGSIRKQAGLRFGFVPQECELNSTFPTTVREFVLLGLVGLATNGKLSEEALAKALTVVDLVNFVDHDYWRLSGGQQQRALLARALIRDPNVLVLDEPLRGVDIVVQEQFMALLVRMVQERNLTVLFVSHRPDIISQYASHLIVVQNGGCQYGEYRLENIPEAYRRFFSA